MCAVMLAVALLASCGEDESKNGGNRSESSKNNDTTPITNAENDTTARPPATDTPPVVDMTHEDTPPEDSPPAPDTPPATDTTPADDETGSGSCDITEMMNAMQFHNAPTLAPTAGKFYGALIRKDWSAMWDMMASTSHDNYKDMMERDKADLDKNISQMEKALEHMPEESRQAMQMQLDGMKARRDGLSGVTTAEEYFILLMDTTTGFGGRPSDEYDNKVITDIVIGEKFSSDGNTGWLKMKNTKTNNEYEGMKFIKEGGKWKVLWGGNTSPGTLPQ